MVIGLGSIIVSFAFVIGPASSKAVEVREKYERRFHRILQAHQNYCSHLLSHHRNYQGILFVLLRKPYDIGDRIIMDEPCSKSDSLGGNLSWIIEKVDLFTTTARMGTTRELATFSNSSLSNMRIINLNRSDNPDVIINLKFSVYATLKQRQLFRRRITAFVKERPRQWSKIVDFRSTSIETDQGFVEYELILQHRERSQNVGPIQVSRGEVSNYAMKLLKELNMDYVHPNSSINTQPFHSTERFKSNFSFLDEPKKEK